MDDKAQTDVRMENSMTCFLHNVELSFIIFFYCWKIDRRERPSVPPVLVRIEKNIMLFTGEEKEERDERNPHFSFQKASDTAE